MSEARGPDEGGTAGQERVLLAEDSPAIADLVSYVLSAAGYDVVHVDSVAHAYEVLARERFDVVVADLRLPDGRGEEIIAAARARGDAIAIVVASGEETAVEGADAVVMKPFSTDDLKAGIRRALELRRARG
ncbi:MAG TPA: response regulator [Kofleriaceae bacterium]|nr:response regulator [Kofleriaceae bacterium]